MRGSIRTLILDDDPQIVRLLSRFVERELGEAAEIITFTDPVEARNWIDRNCADILLTDLDMPTITGLEMLRFTKARNAWTQVIFVTGQSTWDALSEALEHGATDYLVKPLDPAEVKSVLADCIRRVERWRRALRSTLNTTKSVGASLAAAPAEPKSPAEPSIRLAPNSLN